LKTKIAAVLILIYGFFATAFVTQGLSNGVACGKMLYTTPPYGVPALLITSIPLLIATYYLLIRTTKAAWWICVVLIPFNIGVLCRAIVYYLGIHCDGPYQITPDTGNAFLTITAAAIIVLSLVILLSDIKRINRTTGLDNLKLDDESPRALIIASIVIYILTALAIIASTPMFSCAKRYPGARNDIQNAVDQYIVDSTNSSQLPIMNENATFTLTNPNGSYYIINMSLLLTDNGGTLSKVPDGCIELPGPDNDNCDGGATGCSNTSHYIWGMNSYGNIVSKFINSSDMNICQCNTCDGYQDVWP
jgi:hypothetical protein